MTNPSRTEHVDVLIIGAGLSGIGAAARLAQEHPQRSYAVLEARAASGGTWDLFRYPGVRSDSDMFTMGYRFRPWRSNQALADGPSILDYVRDTAREYGVDRADPLRAPGHRRRLGLRHGALDRHRADAGRRPVDDDGRLPVGVQRLLRLRRALPARAARPRASSPAPWSTRSTGPRTSTPPAGGWW